MLDRVRDRQEWAFFGFLPRAAPGLTAAWWVGIVLRAVLPAVFAIAVGRLVSDVQGGEDYSVALGLLAGVFILLQVLPPVHQAIGTALGDRTAAALYDRLTAACVAPPGMGHLEDPALAADLTVARDFDLGMTGPPLSMSMDFIADGLAVFLGGLVAAAVLFGYTWWAPLVLGGAWLATHWLLRESAVWRERQTDEVRAVQRDSDYAYRLAVDPPAAKEVRVFGLADWVVERFIARRRRLHALQYQATRLREKPMIWSVLLVLAANVAVFWAIADDTASGAIGLDQVIVYAQLAAATSMIAFGGLSWALDGASAPVAATLRLQAAMAAAGDLPTGNRPATGMPAAEITFHDVRFAYPTGGAAVLDGLNLTIPAGTSLAIVGQNGAGKTTLAKLLCRLYDPQAGSITVDGIDLREFDLASWRGRLAAVFQDFVRFELSLRENVAPGGAPDPAIETALRAAGAEKLATLDTILARGYEGGTELSGGQWQRVALARALAGVEAGAGLVLLDEPTAQLDVRGEAEIFERLLAATRHCTTILISHRFSTVRQADRICVLEHGRVLELGTHEELMALGGRYRTMFELQAQRFGLDGGEADEEAGAVHDVLA